MKSRLDAGGEARMISKVKFRDGQVTIVMTAKQEV